MIQEYEYIQKTYHLFSNYYNYIKCDFIIRLFSSEYFFNKLRVYEYLDNILECCYSVINNYQYCYLNENYDYYSEIRYEVDKLMRNSISSKINIFVNSIIKDNLFDVFDGLVLKFKVPYLLDKFYTIYSKVKIRNIFIYKSNSQFDKSTLSKYIKCDIYDNMIYNNFIDKLKNSNINLLLLIGTNFNSIIKEILFANNIMFFEWLSWKNYQVFTIHKGYNQLLSTT